MDIVALTSNNEGTPVSLIEAQASGKPVVSTSVGGVEDIVINGKTAFLSGINDKEAFAQNLLKLVEDDFLRKQFSLSGADFVREKFSYRRLCNDMGNLYNSLLSNSK